MLSLLLCSFLLAGFEASQNLGEERGAAVFQAAHEWNFGDARAFANTSDKIESGAGYILGADVDFHRRVGPLVGVGYRYRDGGAWIKRTVWARGGVSVHVLTAVFAADLNSENRVRTAEVRARLKRERFVFEPRLALVRYNGSEWGYHLALMMGLNFGRENA